MIQVKFYSVDLYDEGMRHESVLAGKLFCNVSTIRDLSDAEDFDELIATLHKVKQQFLNLAEAHKP